MEKCPQRSSLPTRLRKLGFLRVLIPPQPSQTVNCRAIACPRASLMMGNRQKRSLRRHCRLKLALSRPRKKTHPRLQTTLASALRRNQAMPTSLESPIVLCRKSRSRLHCDRAVYLRLRTWLGRVRSLRHHPLPRQRRVFPHRRLVLRSLRQRRARACLLQHGHPRPRVQVFGA